MLPLRVLLALAGFSLAAQAAPAFSPILAHPRGALANLDPRRPAELARILDALSLALAGRPYQLGPLGEGQDPSHPLYRLDAFDCTTYLETLMANAYCFRDRGAACLADRMRRIRYGGPDISFADRNHIPELDWLPHNVAKGYLQDLSASLFPGEWKSALSTIHRADWLAAQGHPTKTGEPAPVRLAYLPVGYFFRKAELSPAAQAALDEKLGEAKRAAVAEHEADGDDKELERGKFRADLDYLRAAYVAIPERLAEIPSGTVLNLVRAPGKDPARARLTPLVSHQGLVIQTAKGPRLRHTAPNVGHAMDQNLADYLLRYVRSAKYRGVALYRILPDS